jgi:hypothetical protein
MTPSGVFRQRTAADARDSFDHPTVADADERIGDIWITRVARG